MHEDVSNAVSSQCGREIRDWVIVCGGSRLLCRESPSSGAGGEKGGVTLIGHQYTQSRGALSACWPNKCYPPQHWGRLREKKVLHNISRIKGGGLRTRGNKSILNTFFSCELQNIMSKNQQSSNFCPGSKIPFSKNNKKESNQFCCG